MDRQEGVICGLNDYASDKHYHLNFKKNNLTSPLNVVCIFDIYLIVLCDYAPNFGKVEGAYCFGLVHTSVCPYKF